MENAGVHFFWRPNQADRQFKTIGNPSGNIWFLWFPLRAGKFKAVLSGDQGDLWSTLRGVLLVIQYFLFYLPGDKGKQFSKDIRKLMNRHKSEDIMEYVAYLNDVPWLENKI